MLLGDHALLWPAGLVIWGRGYASSAHKHHSVQLVMALRGSLRIRSGSSREWQTASAALVRPNAMHEVDASQTDVILTFVEPQSDLGAALLDGVTAGITFFAEGKIARWRGMLGEEAEALDAARVEQWVRTQLLHRRKPIAVDERIARAVDALRSGLSSAVGPSLARLASVAGLSPSRFMHLFTRSLGAPLRPYILWLRVQRAAGELVAGRSATEAAHAAGFADSAHLARTFRRMLGSTPSEIARRSPSARDLAVVNE